MREELSKFEWLSLIAIVAAVAVCFGLMIYRPLEAPNLTEKQIIYREHCKDKEYLILRHDLGVVTLNCNL